MIAAVFPGQGSQTPGMGRELVEQSAAASAVFDAVDAATGLDLRAICWESDEDTLRQTQNAQIALFTCGVAAYRAFKDQFPAVEFGVAAGHSIGEYAALVAGGWLSIEAGARLVVRRGELMAASGKENPGTMAAILGLERATLEEVCAATNGIVVVANDNCPGQLVISGEIEAVKAASEAAVAAGAKRALPLNVSGAFHSPLMESSAIVMGESLRATDFTDGEIPVISNVLAAPGADWATLLEAQLKSSVRWTESMGAMVGLGVDTIVEFGAGEVLCGLMKRIDRSVRSFAVKDATGLETTGEALKA